MVEAGIDWQDLQASRERLVLDVVNGSQKPFTIFRPVNPLYQEMIWRLVGRKRQVITSLFGTEDGKPKTMAQVASELGLSRGYVGKLKREAMMELRQPGVLHRVFTENIFGGGY